MSFICKGYRFTLFVSNLNCGVRSQKMTERAVELSIANVFLDTVPRDSVIEVGAVTPYYWPYRVKDICDPADPHKLVNIRESVLDISLKNRVVLSISTFEHIGTSDYGLEKNVNINKMAFEKVFSEADRFLITVPGGYNADMDKYILDLDRREKGVSIAFMVRGKNGNEWREKPNASLSDLTYSEWADSLMILSRGTFFENGITTEEFDRTTCGVL